MNEYDFDFSLSVTVTAENEQQARGKAISRIIEKYGQEVWENVFDLAIFDRREMTA